MLPTEQTPSSINSKPEETDSSATMSRIASDKTGDTVSILNSHDVLFGRTSYTISYQGNVLFREMVNSRKADYMATGRHQAKKEIAMSIFDSIRNNGGRFLRPLEEEATGRAKGDGVLAWKVADENTAMQKIKQALRELGPTKGADVTIDASLSAGPWTGSNAKHHTTIEQNPSSHSLNISLPPIRSSFPLEFDSRSENILRQYPFYASQSQSMPTALGQRDTSAHVAFLTQCSDHRDPGGIQPNQLSDVQVMRQLNLDGGFLSPGSMQSNAQAWPSIAPNVPTRNREALLWSLQQEINQGLKSLLSESLFTPQASNEHLQQHQTAHYRKKFPQQQSFAVPSRTSSGDMLREGHCNAISSANLGQSFQILQQSQNEERRLLSALAYVKQEQQALRNQSLGHSLGIGDFFHINGDFGFPGVTVPTNGFYQSSNIPCPTTTLASYTADASSTVAPIHFPPGVVAPLRSGVLASESLPGKFPSVPTAATSTLATDSSDGADAGIGRKSKFSTVTHLMTTGWRNSANDDEDKTGREKPPSKRPKLGSNSIDH